MLHRKIPSTLVALILGALSATGAGPGADANPPEWIYRPKGNYEGQTDRPLRYWPIGTDFVITNGTFVGWGTIKGKKQYWVNSLSDYLLIAIPGASNQTFTVLGQAGQGIDTNGYPYIWSYLHKGKNTSLPIGKKMYFSFPNTFTTDATQVYPDSQTGNMVLSESSSIYTFVPQSTQTANNTGQTLTDLVNSLTKSLASQGYQTQ